MGVDGVVVGLIGVLLLQLILLVNANEQFLILLVTTTKVFSMGVY